MHETKTFGEIISEMQEQYNLTAAALAVALGCSESYLSLIKSGQRRANPELVRALWSLATAEQQEAMADEVLRAAGVPVIYRLTEQGEAARKE